MTKRYNTTSLSSMIWNELSSTTREKLLLGVLVAGFVLNICISVNEHIVGQNIWYMLLILLFYMNYKVGRKQISRKVYWSIYCALACALVITVVSQVYTTQHYGSGDSVSAFYAARTVDSGQADIVYVGREKREKIYIAKKDISEKEIVGFFSEYKKMELTAKTNDLVRRTYLYNGTTAQASYKTSLKEKYLIISYYE